MVQNWNNILSYVKINLGIKNNFIELSDGEMIDYLSEHSLPIISDYVPNKKWFLLKPEYIVLDTYSDGDYIIPDEYTDNIKEISAIYYNNNTTMFGAGMPYGGNNYFPLFNNTIADTYISNTYQQMIQHMSPVRTFEFYKPNRLKLAYPIDSNVIVEAKYNHVSLDTLPSDIYLLFKQIALRDIIDIIIMMRSKYDTLNTPFNTINMNIDKLETKKQDLTQRIDDYLQSLPPTDIETYIDM